MSRTKISIACQDSPNLVVSNVEHVLRTAGYKMIIYNGEKAWFKEGSLWMRAHWFQLKMTPRLLEVYIWSMRGHFSKQEIDLNRVECLALRKHLEKKLIPAIRTAAKAAPVEESPFRHTPDKAKIAELRAAAQKRQME